MPDSQDEFIQQKTQKQTNTYDNNLAWGNKRGNFYQKDEDQYSEIQEEQEQVQDIIHKIAGEVDDDDFVLQNKVVKKNLIEEEMEEENDYSENIKMLKTEIKMVLKRLKLFEGEEESEIYERLEVGKLSFRQEYVNSHQAYVMTMLMLIKMYEKGEIVLEKHSIIERLGELKVVCDRFEEQQQLILRLKKQSVKKAKQSKKESKSSSFGISKQRKRDQQVDQNLQKYNTLVKRHKRIKKQQKKQRKLNRISSIPSKPFEEVKQNEARNINYTISKNKGLTRRRGKKPRSSRASNREKFEKKMIKYRSAHPMYKDHGLDYNGEVDIKIGKVQSSKLV